MNKTKKTIRQNYTDWFTSLACAGDVLNAAPKLRNGAKEISESMALINVIRPITLAEPMKWRVIDLCAGNALTSLIAVHLLPITNAIAVDISPRKMRTRPKRFEYIGANIHEPSTIDALAGPNTIVVSSHPCKGLAKGVIDAWRAINGSHLALLPCCVGNLPAAPGRGIFATGERYLGWCFDVAHYAGGTVRMDDNCLSPCRGVVRAQSPNLVAA